MGFTDDYVKKSCEFSQLENELSVFSKAGYKYRYEKIFKIENDKSQNLGEEIPSEKWEIHPKFAEEKISRIFMVFGKDKGEKLCYTAIEINAEECVIYKEKKGRCWWRENKSVFLLIKDRVISGMHYLGQESCGAELEEVILPEPFFMELLRKYELIDGNEMPWRILNNPACMELPQCEIASMQPQMTEQERMEHVLRILDEENFCLAGQDALEGKNGIFTAKRAAIICLS